MLMEAHELKMTYLFSYTSEWGKTYSLLYDEAVAAASNPMHPILIFMSEASCCEQRNCISLQSGKNAAYPPDSVLKEWLFFMRERITRM
jgi:hypothetical protein